MIYLDNSATTREYDEVIELESYVKREEFGNPSSLHHLGIVSEERLKESRNEILKHFNSNGKIYFTSSGTEGDNTAIFGAVEQRKRFGKKIITTSVEHPAVLEPMKKLEQLGYTVKYIGVDKNCNLNMDELKSELSDDVILISIMTVNNEVGTIMPINEIKELRDRLAPNAILHTDSVQAFGKIDMKKIDADIITVSGHKIHGPKGVGFIYIKNGIRISPFMLGGGQEEGFRSSTENISGIAGLSLATRLAYTDFENRVSKIRELRDMLKDGLNSNLKDIVINTPENSVCSVLNVSFINTRGEVILHSLEGDQIYVSTGSACSSNHKNSKGSHVLNAMGLSEKEITGAIRFSLSEFTTKEDILKTIEAVTKHVNRFRKLGTFR